MNRRTEVDGVAGPMPGSDHPGPPPGQTVIPFRRANPPPRPAAGGETASSPAPFVSLSDAVQAVVLSTANKRLRLRVARADEREDGGAGC